MSDTLTKLLGMQDFWICIACIIIMIVLMVVVYNYYSLRDMTKFYKKRDFCSLGNRRCLNGDCRKCAFAHAQFLADNMLRNSSYIEKKD